MIISKTVKVKINATNHKYFSELGYDLKELGASRWGHEYETIEVDVNHLMKNSNKEVECRCDSCGRIYKQRFSRNTDICYNPCRKRELMLGNNLGANKKGIPIPSMTGEKHPRWNPNKTEYQRYRNSVYRITRQFSDIWKTWVNSDKIGLCGVDGAYQLDHMVSIKYGFDNMIPAEIIGGIKNLRIIPWGDNRDKWDKNNIDLWDLLK